MCVWVCVSVCVVDVCGWVSVCVCVCVPVEDHWLVGGQSEVVMYLTPFGRWGHTQLREL